MISLREKASILGEMGVSLTRDPTSLRHLRTWIRSLRPGHNPLYDRLPWMNFKVIRWMESYLRRDMTVFEYGTGGSTLFLAPRVSRVVSIENDPFWYAAVLQALQTEGFTNCSVQLVQSDSPRSSENPEDAVDPYESTAKTVNGQRFETYARSIDRYPDQSFGLVMVDGYARLACIAHAVPKVKPNGYLLVDDTDWPKYRQANKILEAYRRTDFVGLTPWQRDLRQTSIWRIS